MTSLLQMVRSYWRGAIQRGQSELIARQEQFEMPHEWTAGSDQYPPAQAVERTLHYQTLIELRQLLLGLAEPARTTVVLVLDEQMSVHLPTLLARETFAFRLVLTSPGQKLLGTLSPGDLALQARAWGWSAVIYERDLPQAIAIARETTAADEQLLILRPAWLAQKG